jgi:hypothetical protein
MAEPKAQRRTLSPIVTAAVALLCLGAWLFVRTAASNAEKDAVGWASADAEAVARTVRSGGGGLGVDQKAFVSTVRRAAGSDGTVARVRVWDLDSTLVASTDPSDRGGKVRPDTGVGAALRGDATTSDAETTYTPLGRGSAATGLLTQAYVPLRLQSRGEPAGALEVDFLRAGLLARWGQAIELALLAAVGLFTLVFVVALARARRRHRPGPIQKVEPPATSRQTVRHDFRAARRAAEAGWVQAPNDGPPPPTSVAELEDATAKIAELEEALQRAAEENEEVRSHAANQEQDIERLRQESSERAAALEEQVRQDEPEIDELREKLAAAEARATENEALLRTAHEELAAAHAQVGDTRVDEPGELAADAGSEPGRDEPASEPEPEDPTDLVAVLEARVAEAEARAESAKQEAMQLSPEASDLRVRLARTAARKKMGSSAG